jgi:hypothetical protein
MFEILANLSIEQVKVPENRMTNHDYEIATREQAEEYGVEILGLGLERRTLPVNYDQVRIWSQTWQKVRLPYEIKTAIPRPLLINEDATPLHSRQRTRKNWLRKTFDLTFYVNIPTWDMLRGQSS